VPVLTPGLGAAAARGRVVILVDVVNVRSKCPPQLIR
jgi:hypothetical protein